KYMPKTLSSKVNRLFPSILDEFDSFLDFPFWKSVTRRYISDWRKTDDGYKLEITLPKYKREDISVNVEGNMLVIESNKKDSPFFMEISIPSYADSENLK